MASMTGTRRIVVTTLILAAASAVFGVIVLASRPMSSTMAGMDMSGSSPASAPADHDEMSGMDMSGSNPTPTPTMAADMPGMDMSGSTPTPTMDPNMPGMDMSGSTPPRPRPRPPWTPTCPGWTCPGRRHDEHGDTAEAPVHRPLAPVLGTFGGGAAAVLLTAGMMRRKDRAASLAKKAARLAGRAQK